MRDDAIESAGEARPPNDGVAVFARLRGRRAVDVGGGIARDRCSGRCKFDMTVSKYYAIMRCTARCGGGVQSACDRACLLSC